MIVALQANRCVMDARHLEDTWVRAERMQGRISLLALA
jgi:hypothetical protein